ncbi:MAG: hypothetical protein ACFFD8_03990 [Candidatus Thorarchaeota archaeon]
MSTDCIEPVRRHSPAPNETPHRDIQREKRLLRQAIAASNGAHRIRLQRELAALEDYEREKRQQMLELPALA